MKKTCSMMLLFTLSILVQPTLAADALKSTLEDQQSVEVTVYNQNLALIKDIRQIQLTKGEGELRFMDVAAYIMPQTVHIISLNTPEQLQILEQNYEYDLMNADKLLDKYVGKKIKLVNYNVFDERKEKEEVEATLLSNNNGQIYQIDNEIYLGHPGYRVLPEIPENLIAQPTLMWLYKNANSSKQQVKVSYLTNNISWKADYVLVVDQKDTSAGLQGWVTIDNRSGATYKNAKLKLVAGEVNRAQDQIMRRMKSSSLANSFREDKAEMFQEESFFEYHIYDLQRATTIKNNQTKQISLLEAEGIQTEKQYIVQGQQHYYTSVWSGQQPKVPVQVYLKFKNDEKNNLGMPLPAGIMRLYKEDSKGSLQFIGEDRIDHTPKNEEIKLKIGEAFDIVAERVQTDYQRINSHTHATTWEVKIRNHKEEDIIVTLLEPMAGDWDAISTTHEHIKEDAHTLRFDVPVPKDGEAVVKYKVRVKY